VAKVPTQYQVGACDGSRRYVRRVASRGLAKDACGDVHLRQPRDFGGKIKLFHVLIWNGFQNSLRLRRRARQFVQRDGRYQDDVPPAFDFFEEPLCRRGEFFVVETAEDGSIAINAHSSHGLSASVPGLLILVYSGALRKLSTEVMAIQGFMFTCFALLECTPL
jgi:hypothetical protein